ncbi:MAG: FAD-dependent oxidoreductase [Acidobacteriota bacterium]|nr:FAD-dependent oxidoreductase [Acidobacteriota bacterium]
MDDRLQCEVLVVGAGYAGLAAARELRRRGVEVLVAEARDRVGGRVWTETTPSGALVDHGGQWVGPGQDHLQALADELSVGTFPTYTTGEGVELRQGRRSTYGGLIPTSDPAAAAEGVEAIFDLDLAAQDVPLEAPWTAPGAEALDGQTLGTWLGDRLKSPGARSTIDAAVKGVFGAEPGEMSLLFALFYLHAGGGLMNLARTTGGAQERRFVGGAQQMARAMAAELGERVLLSSPVRDFAYGDDAVVATVEDMGGTGSGRGSGDGEGAGGRRTVAARRAIVAMPPAVSARIEWRPALPAARSQLAMRAPMGAVVKVHAVYDEPFWRDEGLNGQLVADEGALRITFDDSPPGAEHGVLMGFAAGNDSRALDRLPDGERRRVLLEDLARAFGPRAATPVELVEQRWCLEPYTGGGPVAVCSPGMLTGCGPALRAPVGAVHWAGTETATRWCGYIDGALSSGRRAAAEVLAALGR